MAINNPSYVKLPQTYAGIAVLPANSTSVNVSVSVGHTNYVVLVTPEGVGLTLFITNKTSTGFTINATTAPTANTNIYWFIREIS